VADEVVPGMDDTEVEAEGIASIIDPVMTIADDGEVDPIIGALGPEEVLPDLQY
jgi:hypothetical protein